MKKANSKIIMKPFVIEIYAPAYPLSLSEPLKMKIHSGPLESNRDAFNPSVVLLRETHKPSYTDAKNFAKKFFASYMEKRRFT